MILLSYSARDADAVMSAQAALEAHGLATWIDRRDIVIAERWATEVAEAADRAALVLVFFSSDTFTGMGAVFGEHDMIKAAVPSRRVLLVRLSAGCPPPTAFMDSEPVDCLDADPAWPQLIVAVNQALRSGTTPVRTTRSISTTFGASEAPQSVIRRLWNRLTLPRGDSGLSPDVPCVAIAHDVPTNFWGTQSTTWHKTYLGEPSVSQLHGDIERDYPYVCTSTDLARTGYLGDQLMDRLIEAARMADWFRLCVQEFPDAFLQRAVHEIAANSFRTLRERVEATTRLGSESRGIRFAVQSVCSAAEPSRAWPGPPVALEPGEEWVVGIAVYGHEDAAARCTYRVDVLLVFRAAGSDNGATASWCSWK